MDITVTCVKWQNGSPHFGGRGADYVNRLYGGVSRHITRYAWEMICFTDNASGIRPEVRTMPLPNNLRGTWPKIGLFRKDLPVKTRRILNLDLACVVVGSLDDIIDMQTDFAIARNWPPEIKVRDQWDYAGGAFLLKVGARPQVWDSYAGNESALRGDQEWIETAAPGADLLPYDWTPSYKLRKLGEMSAPPQGAKVIMFHGVPKPHQCGGWVKEQWIW